MCLKCWVFNINVEFESVSFDSNASRWKFVFSDNIFVNAEGFWRLLKDKSIHAVSLAHGHQFGLPEPVNLTTLVTKELTGKKLTRIHVDKNSGDLTLSLSDNIELHIFTTSTVYETYNFTIGKKTYFGTYGGTDLSILEIE